MYIVYPSSVFMSFYLMTASNLRFLCYTLETYYLAVLVLMSE